MTATIGDNKPPRYSERSCPECGVEFTPRRHDQLNCSVRCKVTGANREATRSRQAYRMLYHWRKGHGKGRRGTLFTELTDMVKGWITEDKARGVSAPPLPTDLRLETGDALKDLRTGCGVSDGKRKLLVELVGKQLVGEVEGASLDA